MQEHSKMRIPALKGISSMSTGYRNQGTEFDIKSQDPVRVFHIRYEYKHTRKKTLKTPNVKPGWGDTTKNIGDC